MTRIRILLEKMAYDIFLIALKMDKIQDDDVIQAYHQFCAAHQKFIQAIDNAPKD